MRSAKNKKLIKKFLQKYPFIKRMWQEREKAYNIAYEKETQIEKKYNKIAEKAGLKSVEFAYSDYCFGIDVNDIRAGGQCLKKCRILLHESDLMD
jgi:Sec7-like guanine-nucleotide exchange factor